jgi:hypothetical protein
MLRRGCREQRRRCREHGRSSISRPAGSPNSRTAITPWSSTIMAAWSPPSSASSMWNPAPRGRAGRSDRRRAARNAAAGRTRTAVCKPLERPAAAHPEPGESEYDDRERDRRGEGDRPASAPRSTATAAKLSGEQLTGCALPRSRPRRTGGGPDLGSGCQAPGKVRAGHRSRALGARHVCRHPTTLRGSRADVTSAASSYGAPPPNAGARGCPQFAERAGTAAPLPLRSAAV